MAFVTAAAEASAAPTGPGGPDGHLANTTNVICHADVIMKTRQILILATILISFLCVSACDESTTEPTISPYLAIDSISAIYYNIYDEDISDSVTVLGVYKELRFVHRPGRIVSSSYRFLEPWRWPIEFGSIFDRCILAPVPADTTLSGYSELELPQPYISDVDSAVAVLGYEVEFYDAIEIQGECKVLNYGYYTWIDTLYAVYSPR